MFGMSGVMKLIQPPSMTQSLAPLGLPASIIFPLGFVELGCLIIYLIPKTSVLGAVLLTGYLGGAILTHLRVGDSFLVPLLLGVVVWAGIYLRDERLRALLPFRK